MTWSEFTKYSSNARQRRSLPNIDSCPPMRKSLQVSQRDGSKLVEDQYLTITESL